MKVKNGDKLKCKMIYIGGTGMSYDFRIVGSERLKNDDLRTLLKELDLQLLSGDADTNYFTFGKNENAPIGCDITRIDSEYLEEDLEEALAWVTLAPQWKYVLTVPLKATKSELTRAGDFAKKLAEIICGAAIDPQVDKILYPKGKKQRYIADLSQERINVIEMKWFLAKVHMTEDIVRSFLKQIEKILPEALPLRYGNKEPMPYVFREKGKCPKNDKIEDFILHTMEQKNLENVIYWNSERPCFGGGISFGCENFSREKEAFRCDTISLTFDARACNSDGRWIHIFEELFLQVSKELSPIYGMAFVEENIGISKKGTLWYNGKEKRYPIPYYHCWSGIPGYPMWMSWFGKPYVSIIEPTLKKGFAYRKEQNGIYYCAGMNEPMVLETAKLHFPQLPERLLTKREYILKTDGSLSEYNYVDIPAEVVPDIL